MSSSYLPFLDLSLLIGRIGFVANAIFGSILVYSTLFHIKKQFGSYKYLIVNFQVLGFIFAAFDFIFPTFMHTYNGGLFSLGSSRPFNFPNRLMEWLMATYTGLYSATISFLAIQFIYRYWAIFEIRKLKYFRNFYYLIWVFYYTACGVLWALGVGHFCAPDEFVKDYVAEELWIRYQRNVSDIPLLALVAYENDKLRMKNVYAVGVMTGISCLQYIIIFICGRKMFIEMKNKLLILSPQVRRLHQQFFRALVIQVTAPSIILFFPVFFMILVPFADLKISFPSSVIQSGFTVYPAMDSVIMMTCVSEYHRVFKKFLQRVRIPCKFPRISRSNRVKRSESRSYSNQLDQF